MKKLSKRNIKLTGLIALFALVFALGLNASTVKVNAEGETKSCEHKNLVKCNKDPYKDKNPDAENQFVDGYTIDCFYCKDCGKYARDDKFNQILTSEEVESLKEYYVEDEITVELGGDTLTAADIMNESGFEKVDFEGIDFSKYKYIKSHNEKDVLIKTTTNTKLYKNTLKSITIKVVTKCADPNKKYKYVKVKFVLPTPKGTYKAKWNSNKSRCTYTYTYNIKGATKIQIRMINGNNGKVIKDSSLNKSFDKYMKKPKSNKDSYMWLSKKYLSKYNNNVDFQITAFYGKKKVTEIMEKK